MEFELINLPYAYDALEPFISKRTVEIHHTKHHAGYVKKLAAKLEDDSLKEESLETILLASSGSQFNLAAQVWNHDFYWQSMTPTRSKLDKEGRIAELIESSFGGLDAFRNEFDETASNEFGSGWAWLAYHPEKKKLEVFSTTDALNPLTSGRIPLLTLDVWEHAYYLDFQNERGRYIDQFLDEYINWAFAESNLQAYLDQKNENNGDQS